MQKDPRNFLFESYIKILKHFRPKFFVFENVVGLLSATVQGVAILQIILRELGKHYKLIEEPNDMVLNSVHYGVPQERRRLIILGVRRDIDMTPDEVYSMIDKTHYSPEDEAEGNTNGLKRFVTVHEAIADLPPLLPGAGEKSVSHEFPEDEMSTYAKSMRTEKELSIMDHVARRHNDLDQERYYEMAKNNWTFREMLEKRPHLQHDPPRVFGNSYVVQRWNRPAKTIIAHLYKDGNQFIHPDSSQRRTLTAREAARLQSFPDNFEFPVSRTQQYKQIGNAVPPLLAERIAIALRRALDQIKE